MSTPLRLAPLPSYQHYDCQGCGNCCRGIFVIRITTEERDRIRAQGWESDPELQGIELFKPAGEKGKFLLAHRDDGSCVFLDERGLCRIHAKFGEPTKPLACRVYPFKLIPTGDRVRADLRCDCPAIPANHGRSLSEYRDAVREFIPLVVPPAAAELPPAPLYGRVQLDWSRLERVNELFLRLVQTRSLDLTTRLVACVNVSAALHSKHLAVIDEHKLREMLEVIYKKVVATAVEDPLVRLKPLAIERLTFRQLLGLYGREDRRGERGVLLKRLSLSLRMLAGQGLVPPLRLGFPEVPFAALDEPLGLPPDEVVEPLARYLRLRLESMGFFGPGFFGYPYLDGLNVLLLTYPLTFWFARVFAAEKGLPAPDRACIERGISIVNHYHGMLPVFNLPLERFRFHFLCERGTLRRLLLWYGR